MSEEPQVAVEPTADVDAILLVSFGGPNHADEVMPFLRNVTRGRDVPDERLLGVAEHYYAVGGASPINAQNEALIEALRVELAAHGCDLPVYWGNRNWDPLLVDTMAKMAADGRREVVAFVTSAFSSFSGCRQYRDDIQKACDAVGPDAPHVIKIRQFFNHPGFIEPMVDNTRTALASLPDELRTDARLIFTAHSIPLTMAESSRYESQLHEAAALIVGRVDGDHEWEVVFQSRSGSPRTPWLEPDINDHLRSIKSTGTKAAVMIPVGFISDHMEVVHDLDTEARQTADEIGLPVTRANTVGTDARFVSMIRELVMECTDAAVQRRALGSLGVVGCLGNRCCVAPA